MTVGLVRGLQGESEGDIGQWICCARELKYRSYSCEDVLKQSTNNPSCSPNIDLVWMNKN